MSQETVVLDEQALGAVADALTTYGKSYREALEEAVRSLNRLGNDWNDEDFNALLSAISSFLSDLEAIDGSSAALTTKIQEKIQAIHVLHAIKI